MDALQGIKRMEDLHMQGLRVFMRVDFNCPLSPEGRVADDTRIQAALPSIRYAIGHGAKVVLASHLGRPKGRRVPELSMAAVGERLAELLDQEIYMPEDCIGDAARKVIMERADGEVVLLENLRFHEGETSNDDLFAQRLAALADVYINDAFGAAHRAHASVVGIARHLQSKAAGMLMLKELTYLGGLRENPLKPFVVVVGGAKVSDKIGALGSLLRQASAVVIGGAMANTFLRAKGVDVGCSRVEEDNVEGAANFLRKAMARGVEVFLPEDVVVAAGPSEGAESSVVDVKEIPQEQMILDIGPRTIDSFTKALSRAKTIFWNGPMGVFEKPRFARGTESIGKAIARSGGTTVAGGGDTVAAIARFGLTPFFTHISTGGGAALRFLEGKELPGVEGLREAQATRT